MDGNNEFLVKRWSDIESNSSTEVEYLRLASYFIALEFCFVLLFSGVFCLVGVTPHKECVIVWNTVPLCYPVAQSGHTMRQAGALTTVLNFATSFASVVDAGGKSDC
jgi:hypothetical protein